MRIPFVTAHSSCMGTKMNSIEYLEKAMKSGVDIIEVDVSITKDKGPEEVLLNIDIKDWLGYEVIVDTIVKEGISERVFITGYRNHTFAQGAGQQIEYKE